MSAICDVPSFYAYWAVCACECLIGIYAVLITFWTGSDRLVLDLDYIRDLAFD